jgi:DNA adenine methylase
VRIVGSDDAEPVHSVRRSSRPLLKWAGGKRQLLPVFGRFYPERFGRYIEPFVGSAAVFFDLHGAGRLAGHGALLADRNPDLIGCYLMVRDEVDRVLAVLARLERRHARDGVGCYYEVRDRFNVHRARRGVDAGVAAYTPALAAMLIYLNRAGFNGLFRLNASGAFNVPAGRYARPRIHDPSLLRTVQSALAGPGVVLRHSAYEDTVAEAKAGDLLYLDPPYAALSRTSAFGAYTAAPFTGDDQRALCRAVGELAVRGCHVMLSNSSAPDIVALYREAARTNLGAGLALWEVHARRAINSRASSRGHVAEVLLTNLRPRSGEGKDHLVRLS